jgi:hypothetical protein
VNAPTPHRQLKASGCALKLSVPSLMRDVARPDGNVARIQGRSAESSCLGNHMKRRTLAAIAALFGTHLSPIHAKESPQISRIQATPVSTLEFGAPQTTLVQWLARLAGNAATEITWETNDCGEGGDGRAAPTCVEGKVLLGAGTTASVSVAVADTQGRPTDKPSLYMVYLKSGQKVTFAKSLKDLEAIVSDWRK